MAEIYNPWQQPSTEFSGERAEHEYEYEGESANAPEGELLAEALSVIDQQSRTIQKLMALLSGEAPGAGDIS